MNIFIRNTRFTPSATGLSSQRATRRRSQIASVECHWASSIAAFFSKKSAGCPIRKNAMLRCKKVQGFFAPKKLARPTPHGVSGPYSHCTTFYAFTKEGGCVGDRAPACLLRGCRDQARQKQPRQIGPPRRAERNFAALLTVIGSHHCVAYSALSGMEIFRTMSGGSGVSRGIEFLC